MRQRTWLCMLDWTCGAHLANRCGTGLTGWHKADYGGVWLIREALGGSGSTGAVWDGKGLIRDQSGLWTHPVPLIQSAKPTGWPSLS